MGALRASEIDAELVSSPSQLDSIRRLARRRQPGSETSPGLVSQQLHRGQCAVGLVFAEFAVEERIVEARSRRIGCAGTVVNGVDARPVRGRQAHRTGLAAGVKLASCQRERAQRLAGGTNGVDFAVSRGVQSGGHGVNPFAHNLAVAHNHRGERAACARFDIPDSQCDCTAQKLRIWSDGCRQLAQDLPQRRK